MDLNFLIAQAAASSPPAGGAAIGQIVIATTAAAVVTAVLLYVGMGHRSGKVALLSRVGAYSERVSGLPSWAAIPAATITGSLLVALFGMLWDISLHIAQGRDEGPLANPAHYFILAGLFGIFASGFLSMALPKDKPGDAAVRISKDWYAPLGGVLITGGGARRASEGEPGWVSKLNHIALPGGFLLGLSTFQAEFDFGVPQFRFVFHPMLIMLAAGAALVAARVWLGRGAALGAALFFIAIRAVIALLVGPVLGEPTPHFPLYVVEALVIEAVALRMSPRRPIALGAVCGALIGTVGLAAEWTWSQVFMPIPWPSELLPEGAIL